MKKIRTILEEIIGLMTKYHVEPWREILEAIAGQLERAMESERPKHAVEALESLKELYGGMGSFNDVFISPEAGHQIPHSKVNSVNAELQRLQTLLYQEIDQELNRVSKE